MSQPTARVLLLLEFLQSKSLVTGREIADRLECEIRTVRRYIKKLEEVGIQVESLHGPSGGYRLKPGSQMPPVVFSETEAIALTVALVSTPWIRVSIPMAATESALFKITRSLPLHAREKVEAIGNLLVTPSNPGTSFDMKLLLSLCRASEASLCVRLVYRHPELTIRIVEPWGVSGWQGHWYLIGFCRLRGDIRVFRLDRIQSADVLVERFVRPTSFDLRAFIEHSIENQRWKVHLIFISAPLEAIRDSLGSVGEVKETSEGYEYRGSFSDLDLLARQLLLSRLAFRVIGPPELRSGHRRGVAKVFSD